VQGLVGRPAGVNLVIFRQPGANIVETVDRIAALPRLQPCCRPRCSVGADDRTQTIRASLHEVESPC
jgi:multidrug efflux pump subunit AcrB